MEALKIFYEIVTVVENLHNRNIIHRDLKLGNIVLNKSTNKITITNFCLGKYLLNESDLLYDQRGVTLPECAILLYITDIFLLFL